MTLTNLQETLARNSDKVCVTIAQDNVLAVLFGSEPDLNIIEELQTLSDNKCFDLLDSSCFQNWSFRISRPQSVLQVGKAIVRDLKKKGLKIEIRVEKGNGSCFQVETDFFLGCSSVGRLRREGNSVWESITL